MSLLRTALLLSALVLACGPVRAAVVLNEVMYHAPNDLDDLQYVELHNTGAEVVDLAGWKFARGVRYAFAAGAKIEAGGYLVVCKNLKQFRDIYGFDGLGPFEGSLSHSGETIELAGAKGEKIDAVKYRSRAPWPATPDGYGASLERVCPTASADVPENWAPSSLRTGAPKPAGTPGKKNSAYSPQLPPVVADVTVSPPHAAPEEEVKVEATVRSSEQLRDVELRYRVAGSGSEKAETTVAMTKGADGRYTARVPGQKAGQIIRVVIRAVDANGTERLFPSPNELRPAVSIYVHEKFKPGKVPFGFVINVGRAEFRAAQGAVPWWGFGPPKPEPPPQGKSAYVHVDAKTGVPQLFDYVTVNPRKAGYKVHFHKDRSFGDMTTINLLYEQLDRFVLAEALAYEVYRKAGNATLRTDFVRTWIDGRPIGYHLLVEQPNRAFLRHNGLNPDGNLYKIIWYGSGLVGQHEKKTNVHNGHDDVAKLAEELGKTKGDEQWAVIKKHFDVDQVINYFAVNTLLSHWDGFFNNHFVYHDVRGTGKWTMYPWDQDKTWGFHDGVGGYDVFTDMPLTFGMNGDPQQGTIWWRGPGHFSGPLLANPTFRKLFLARTKELLEKVYTEDVFFPVIKEMGERIEEEVAYRAEVRREDPKVAVLHLKRNLDALRRHLTERRKFLLAQEEIRKAGK
jgi:hypothetical protein